MKTIIGVCAALALALVLAGERGPSAGDGASGAINPRVERVTFGPSDVIEGSLQGPNILDITVVTKPRHENLIRYRVDFNEKVLTSHKAL